MFKKIKTNGVLCLALLSLSILPSASCAREEGGIKKAIVKKIIKKKLAAKKAEAESKGSTQGLYQKGQGTSTKESVKERTFIAYTPASTHNNNNQNRPLLIVLHGGGGSAAQIQKYIGLAPLADKHNFIIAYLDGTKVAGKLPAKFKGWNAGDCCGQPQIKNIDDLSFIRNVVDFMHKKYAIDKNHVYGTGHSNGAMMTQRIICETNLYKDAITFSGTLQMNLEICPEANGSRIMNVHGTDDTNVPIEGGHTVGGINKRTDYKSQERTKNIFQKSGVNYELLLLESADHSPRTINDILIKAHGMTMPEKIIDYLNLDSHE